MSNPFAVLASANTSDNVEEVNENEEYTTESQGFNAVAGDKVLTIGEAHPAEFPQTRVQHLAVAHDKYAYVTSAAVLCAGSITELSTALEQAKNEKSATTIEPSIKVHLKSSASHIAFSADGFKLYVAGSQGGLSMYASTDLQSAPQELQIPRLTDLVPNPSDTSLAMLSIDGVLSMMTEQGINTVASDISAISWSKKGKQIIASSLDGHLQQYTPQGVLKAEIPPFTQQDIGHVHAINWLENNLFLLAYLNDDQEVAIYLLRRATNDGMQTLTYTAIPNPSLSFGDTSHPVHYTFMSLSKSLVLTASSVSADLGLVSITRETSLAIDDDLQKAVLRFSPQRDAEVSITGLAIQSDISNGRKLIWYVDNDGGCGAWQIRDDDNSLIEGKSISTLSDSVANKADSVPTSAATPSQQTPSAPVSSPFTGTSKIGAGNSLPFASMANSTQPSSVGQSPFALAQSGAPKSIFGSNAQAQSGRALDQATKPAAFPTDSKPAAASFGSSAFGSSAFNNAGLGTAKFGSNSTFAANKLSSFSSAASNISRPFAGFSTPSTQLGNTATTKKAVNSSIRTSGDDSDDEGVKEDKLAKLDEQEPAALDNDLDLGSTSSLNLGQSISGNGKAPFNFSSTTSTNAFPKQTPVSSDTASPATPSSTSAFGQFSFPQPKPGGFGFGGFTPASKTAQTSFGFGDLKAPANETTTPAFGFTRPDTFGFTPVTRSAHAKPSDETAKLTSTASSLQPTPQEEAAVNEPDDAPLPPDPISQGTEAKTSEGDTQVGQEQSKPPDEAATLPLESLSDQVISREADESGVPQNEVTTAIEEEHSSTKAASDEIKHIPPFDFTAAIETQKSEVSSEESYVNLADTTEQNDFSEKGFTTFSDEAEDEEEEADADENNESLEQGSESENDEESDEYETEEGSEEELDQDTHEASEDFEGDEAESDSESASPSRLSAFAPKTPAFSTSRLTGNQASPFADNSLLSAFGAASPSPANNTAGPVFDFAGAAKSRPTTAEQEAVPPTKPVEPSQAVPDVPKIVKPSPFNISFNTGSAMTPSKFSFSPLPATSKSDEKASTSQQSSILPASTLKSPALQGSSSEASAERPREQQQIQAIGKFNFVPTQTPQEDNSATVGKEPQKSMGFGFGSQGLSALRPRIDQNVDLTKSSSTLNSDQKLVEKSQPAPETNSPSLPEISSNVPKSQDPPAIPRTIADIEVPAEPQVLHLQPYATLTCTNVQSSERGIARELDILIQTLTKEFATMADNLRIVDDYLIRAPDFPNNLNDVSKLQVKVESMLEDTNRKSEGASGQLRIISSIKSSMITLEGQRIKIQRLIRAQTDPAFAQSMKISSLGPEYLAQQKELRKKLATVEKDLRDFQSSLSLVKAKLVTERNDTAMAPTPEKIAVAVAKIMRIANEREREMERLQRKFVSLQTNATTESLRASTSLSHRSRKSRAQLSIDNSFDLSMAQLSIDQSQDTLTIPRSRGSEVHKAAQLEAAKGRKALEFFREALIKRGPLKTVYDGN